MADERITWALNLLGENADLLAADREGLLDLIEDYFDDHLTSGNSPVQPTGTPSNYYSPYTVYYEIHLRNYTPITHNNKHSNS